MTRKPHTGVSQVMLKGNKGDMLASAERKHSETEVFLDLIP